MENNSQAVENVPISDTSELIKIPNDQEIKLDVKINTQVDESEMVNDIENNEAPEKAKNPYSMRKVSALGMMDIALLTANANQIRFLITYNTGSPTYYLSLTLIILSLILQVFVGILLIFKRHMKNNGNEARVDKSNIMLTIGIYLITLINVFVASFTVTESPKAQVERL